MNELSDFPRPQAPQTPLLSRLWRRTSLALLSLVLAGCASTAPGWNSTDPNPGGELGDAPLTRSLNSGSGAAVIPGGTMRPIVLMEPKSSSVAHLAAPADLWERIRRGFAMPDLYGDLVRDREQWYINRPEYIERMTQRSSKYLFHIVEELERRNMPTELALLPYIESAFNPQAVSSAKAVGMWQFMPATGKDFDLKQNAFRDDRRDVLASTRAALDYLQMLHGMFDDWHLALAAYNWGQGSVKRAVERNQRNGLPTGYEHLTMPQETRMYVPKLQAVKNLIANPQRHKGVLPQIPNHPFFDTVVLQNDIDVALVAKLAEVEERDFRTLNPSFNRPVILAEGNPQILLPWDNAATFEHNLRQHPGSLASWTAWAVPSAMRPADIAQKVKMSEAELRRVNDIPPRMLVKAGSTLLVPRDEGAKANVPEHMADNGQVALQADRPPRRTTVKAKRGDTVRSLATRYRVSASDVAEWNQLKADAPLKTGQVLALFIAAAERSSSAASRPTPRASSKKPTHTRAKKR